MRESHYNAGQRLTLLSVACALLFLGLAVRLINLQVVRAGYYTSVAESQRKRAADLLPHRGTIYVSEGRRASDDRFPIATNQKAWLVYAVPRDIKEPDLVSRELAPVLAAWRQRQRQRTDAIIAATGQQRLLAAAANQSEAAVTPPPTEGSPAPTTGGSTSSGPTLTDETDILREQLYNKLNRKTDPYEPLMRPYETVDDELRQFIADKQWPGIVLEEQEVRAYPEKTLAAHVLGYVGYQEEGRVGRYGVEGFFEKVLSGDLGFLSAERDTKGGFIGVGAHEFKPAQDGADVVLTIDRVIQAILEEELKTGVERYAAERGSIVAMNPKTGAVLGMATYPTFDPNYYYAIADARVQLNPVVSDLFEPGSILKPVVMAAAMEEGKIEPSTTFVDNGPVKVDKYTINTFDGKHYGLQTMTQILEQSNNVGMVWVGQQLGAELLYDYFRRFGLGEKTGIELEGETQSTLPEPAKWNVATVATTSFGQGIALTPLQALNAVNVLANDGKLMQPHIVARIKGANGAEEVTTPAAVGQVVSPETADKVSAMMVSVIENGVAGLARVPGYYLAGKTGTAQVPDERGAYSPDRKIISFVGFGPMEDPQFSVLIKLDNPAGLSFASGTAAPMFHNVAQKILQYYQIPPSYDSKQKQERFEVPGPIVTDPETAG